MSWLEQVPVEHATQVERVGSRYAYRNGPYPAWLGFCERLLASADNPTTRSNVLWTLSRIGVLSGKLDRALEAAEEKARIDRERGAGREAALAADVIADIRQARGQLDEALRIRQEEELPLYERLGDVRSRAITLGQIADIRQARGQLDEALRIRQEEELPVYKRLGNVHERAMTLGKIADIRQAQGQLDEALRILQEEVLPVLERLGAKHSLLVTRANLAILHQKRARPGDRDAAAELLRLALRDAEAMQIPEADQIRALQQKYGFES